MNINDSTTWRVVKNSQLIIDCFGKETVVYNTASGGTHQLDEFSNLVLDEMKGQEFTLAFLLKKMTDTYELGDVKLPVVQLISQFDHIGLIEPIY